jgi:hypothetical protein
MSEGGTMSNGASGGEPIRSGTSDTERDITGGIFWGLLRIAIG